MIALRVIFALTAVAGAVAAVADGDLFPPPGITAVNSCFFETNATTNGDSSSSKCAWSVSSKSQVPFRLVGEKVRAYGLTGSSKVITNNFIRTPAARKTARITTAVLYPPRFGFQAVCISFQYKISGSGATKLTLYQRSQPSQSDRQVWQISGSGNNNNDAQWQSHTSQITTSTPVVIALAAYTAAADDYVAVDDIRIFNTTCFVRDGDGTKPYIGDSRANAAVKATIWTGRVVPYLLTDGFSVEQVQLIKRFMQDVGSRTCLRFQERTNQADYIKFVKIDSGCVSDLGKTGGLQLLQLGSDCFTYSVLSHTIFHALGLRHEHVRSDRDNFVRVLLDNVDTEDNKKYFTKRQAGVDTELESVAYDKQSVMHFPNDLYAKVGMKTLTSVRNINEQLGNSNGPRDSDFQKVANLYCSGTTVKPGAIITPPSTQPTLKYDDEVPCMTTSSVSGSSGTIASYIRSDGTHRVGENCGWKISVRSGRVISLQFTFLDLFPSKGCTEDSAEIYNGVDDSLPPIVSVCGQQFPVDIYLTSGNVALVKFTTSDTLGTGFRIEWKEVSPQDELPSNAALSPVDCSFDFDQCSWVDSSTSGINWRKQTLSTITQYDHTTQSDLSSYMSVDASNSLAANRAAIMRAGRIQASDGFSCLTFWYRMADSARSVGTLEVTATTSSGQEISLWQSTTSSDAASSYSDWVMAQVPVSAVDGTAYRISFKAFLRRRTQGGIAVDDVSLSQDLCDGGDNPSTDLPPPFTDDVTDPPYPTPTTWPASTGTIRPSPGFASCDFESSFCNWQMSPASDVNWLLKRGKSTSGSDYGVTVDHTRGTAGGQYIVVNALPTKGIARLDTTVAANAGYKCFEFYYMMYGLHVGGLVVKAIPNGGQDELVLFEATGNKDKKWLQGKASLDGLTGQYTLRLEARVTGQSDGDVAVDDVVFRTSNCYSGAAADPMMTTYSTPPNSYFCDFEDGNMCLNSVRLTDDSQSPLVWESLQPADVNAYGGPDGDHSRNDGNGYFAGAKGGFRGTVASMTSKRYRSGENDCMTFWYYMSDYVLDTASLDVYVVTSSRQESLLISLKGTSGNRHTWINPQVVIPGNTGEFSIRFKATSSGIRSLILVDDIALSKNSKCSKMARVLQLNDGSERRRREAIPQYDSGDQLPAGYSRGLPATGRAISQPMMACRFGSGSFCSWTASTNWKVVSTSAQQDILGHDDRFAHVTSGRLVVTQGNSRGLPASADMTSNITATLTSETVTPRQSCLHFWYKIGGWFRDLPMDTLNVFIRTGTSSTSPRRLVATFSGSMSPLDSVDEWVEEKLTLFESTSFQVIFEAMTGDSWLGTIAIDDVQLQPTTCPKATFS